MDEMSSVTVTDKDVLEQAPVQAPALRQQKSRLELDEAEDSDEYWSSFLTLVRHYRHHCVRKDFYEQKLRSILPGSGLKLCPEIFFDKDPEDISSISSDKPEQSKSDKK